MRAAHTPLFLALSAATLTAEDLAAAPVFQMVLSGKKGLGVRTVSLVENPAIEVGWVALSAQVATSGMRVHLSDESADEQVVTGPALIPDKKILRIDPKTKKPFYIQFSAEQIREIARRYAKEGHHNSTNEAHSIALEGNVVEGSWIVRDTEKGEAAALGFTPEQAPVGTWMLSMHVPDADTWAKIKKGELLGFSIEGAFNQEEIQLAALQAALQSTMKKPLWARLFSGPTPKTLDALALQAVTLKDGKQLDVAEDGTVSELDEEGNITGTASDGEYELPDGTKLVVKGGKKEDASASGSSDATKKMEMAEEGDTATAKTELEKAIALHEKHMAGTAPTDEASQQEMMDLMKKALAALGAKPDDKKPTEEEVKASAVKLLLEAVEMADGSTLSYNPISRLLSDANGVPVPSGYHACKDGSYFRVETSQYTYSIDAETYAKATTQLSAAEQKLQEAETKLSAAPAAGFVALGGDTTKTDKPLPPHLAFLQAHQS